MQVQFIVGWTPEDRWMRSGQKKKRALEYRPVVTSIFFVPLFFFWAC